MTTPGEWRKGDYVVSTDPARLDLDAVFAALKSSYWGRRLTRDVFDRAVEGSMVFGLYHGDEQTGFARVITDRATFAYLTDMFVIPDDSGHGLGSWMVEVMLSHPELKGLRRWALITRDAQDFYEKHGFEPVPNPEHFMRILGEAGEFD